MPTRRFIGGWCPGASSCDCPLILDSRMMATVCRVSRFVNMSSRRMRRSRASTCSRQWGSAASAGAPRRGGGRSCRPPLKPRADRVVELVETTPGPWIVWCGLNDEQEAIAEALDGDCVSVAGNDPEGTKRERIMAFLSGQARVLVTKARIAGFGLNLQHCHQMAFLGLGDSYETYYQSIRRCYRFGQTEPVQVHIVVSEAETGIVRNVQQKEVEARRM